MTKSEKAALWFKNGLERRKMQQVEDHVHRVVKKIMLAAIVIFVVIYFVERWVIIYG